jgi:hypothetical protein
MKRIGFTFFAALLVAQGALAQPRADMRLGWMSEAEEIELSGNLGEARTGIRNIAIDFHPVQVLIIHMTRLM